MREKKQEQHRNQKPFVFRTRALRFGRLLFALFIFLSAHSAAATTDTFTAAGSNTWVAPDGVYSVTAEAWGGGGGSGGGTNTGLPGGSGGGGGAYASKGISVTPGISYSYTVGAAGIKDGGASGGSSIFTGDASIQVIACGGTSGAANGGTAGAGGTTACSDGTIEFAGGSGAAGAGTVGGGGGESASTTANGNNASGQTGGTGRSGTDGSAGQAKGANGVAGNNPGGGAGGSGQRSGGSEVGASGGVGRVRLTGDATLRFCHLDGHQQCKAGRALGHSYSVRQYRYRHFYRDVSSPVGKQYRHPWHMVGFGYYDANSLHAFRPWSTAWSLRLCPSSDTTSHRLLQWDRSHLHQRAFCRSRSDFYCVRYRPVSMLRSGIYD